MDLVVRSPHGTADVSVEADRVASLGDVVAEVTGQAVPGIVIVDDHVLPASTPLTDENVRVGSVVSTVVGPTEPLPAVTDGVQLVQHTGRGAGTIRTIAPGRYRIGPGRRMAAAELGEAPVEQAAFELLVTDRQVEVHPVEGSPVMLAGRQIGEPTIWADGDLAVGARVFGFDRPGRSPVRRPSDPDGTVAFTRSAVLTRADDPRSVADAVRMALGHDAALWRRRLDEHASLTLPVGLVDEGAPTMRRVSVMLGPDLGVALVGSDDFGEALGRTLLVEAVTAYGPADVHVVIATSPDRAGRWDWAKWLPHVRDRGQLTILATAAAQRRWADRLWTERSTGRPITVLVVDDADHWSRRASALREVVSSPPTTVRLVVHCDRVDRVPASCRSLVVQDGDDVSVTSATAMSGVRGIDHVVPSLVDNDVATEVARALAPLVDIATDASDGHGLAAVPESPLLADALRATIDQVDKADAARHVWLGTSDEGRRVELDWQVTSEVSIVASEAGDADAVVVALVAGLIAEDDASRFPLLLIDDGRPSAVLDVLGDLPHVGGRVSLEDPLERRRILERIANHLDTPGAGAGIVLVGSSHEGRLDGWIGDLRALADRVPALRLVTARHGPAAVSDRPPRAGRVEIAIDRLDGTPSARMTSGHERRSGEPGDLDAVDTVDTTVVFAPLSTSPAAARQLAVRPFVVGRPFTSLERRVARNVATRPGLDASTHSAVAALLAKVSRGTPPVLVPPPLPGEVDVDMLFAAYEADAIPLGVLDDPADATHPVVWWQPGRTGSIVFVGSPRAGLDRVVSTIVRGVAERVSPSDLRLIAVDSSSRRLAAVAAMPHSAATIPADRTDQVAAALEHLAGELDLRRRDPDLERPELVLLVHDLGQVVRRLVAGAQQAALASLDEVARAAGLGISVVAVTSTIAGVSGLLDSAADVYVGLMTNDDELRELGLDELAMTACSPGRCWSRATGRLVQLASAVGPT